MFKMLGAAVAAVTLSCASAATASTLIYSGVVDAENYGGQTLDLSLTPGLYTFKSGAQITKYQSLWADLYGRYHGHAADGASWGYGWSPSPWPTAPVFAQTADGFTMFFAPPQNRESHSDGCYYVDSGCNFDEEWQYRVTWYLGLRFADGSAGTPYEIYFDAAPPASAVPEPATWALLISGFGLAGAALRRRRVFATA